MIGLSRLKRAITDVPTGGMQTGTSKVQLKLCDAQRIEVEYGALIAERDAALAREAELVAQVEYIKSHFNELIEVAQRCDSWESFPQKPLDRAVEAIASMPANCLRNIQAEAGRAGFVEASQYNFTVVSDHFINGHADEYAERVKAGEV